MKSRSIVISNLLHTRVTNHGNLEGGFEQLTPSNMFLYGGSRANSETVTNNCSGGNCAAGCGKGTGPNQVPGCGV
jgi:hypothetical protein